MTTQIPVVRTGSALAITAVLLNGACAAMIALWPAEAIGFANSWMHGVDLRPIQTTAPVTLLGFLAGSIGLAVVGFVVGSVYAWVYNGLHRLDRTQESRQHAAG
jgi:hypothetical protein